MGTYKWPLILTLPLLLIAANSPAAMYKWVDENGVTQYGQHRPQNKEVEVVDPPPSPASGRAEAQQRLEKTLEQLDERAKARAETTAKTEQAAAEKKQNKENCRGAKANLANLQSSRHRFINNEGVASYLPEEERQKKIATTREQVKKFCK